MRPQAETVLAVSWGGDAPGLSGAVSHHCWRGLFFVESFDADPQGPFGTLDGALDQAGPETFRALQEVSSMTMHEDDLLALVYRRFDRDADNVTVNGTRYLLKDGELIPEAGN